MPRFVRIGLVAALILLVARSSSAQETSARADARAFLKPHVQNRVVLEDTLVRFRTDLRPSGRIDLDDNVVRAEYNVKTRVEPRLSPDAAAFAYLEQAADRLGIRRPSAELAIKDIRYGRRSSHVTLQQVYRGVPVHNREVKVNLDADGQPTMVLNGFAPHLAAKEPLSTTPGITKEDAVLRVQEAGRRDDLETTTPELAVYPSDSPRLIWLLRAAPASGAIEWEVLVDAQTGEIIQMIDLSLHAHRPASPAGHEPIDAFAGKTEVPAGHETSPTAGYGAMVDGTGLVFDPDPITTAGVPYGPPYVDGNDGDIPELNAERKMVTLRDISRGADGLYRLDGPYVRIDGTCGRVTGYEVPAETSPDGFHYTRADDYFEAVNSYYHIDKSQRYVQALDVGFDIKNEPVRVNPHGLGNEDNSQYINNCIMLGTGGIDDAEDADVLWHEYAHALLDFTSPGMIGSGGESRAIHEGWSDYWAASYSRFLSEEDPDIAPHDWWRVFTWDGNLPCWPGRPLDHPGHYPDAVISYPTSGCPFYDVDYQKGMLWATTLMEIYSAVGRTVLDRLNLASHIYIGRGATFVDAAQAIVQADEDLYGGIHANVLIEHFSARGYVDPATYGPILSHEPLQATEDLGGEVRIDVTAVGTSADVDSVLVYYDSDGSASGRVVLDPAGGDDFAGDLPLPLQPTVIHYYVEAVDLEGRRRRLPPRAPVETYAFNVGPDGILPSIAHDAPLNVSVVGWPMDVYAEVHDNLGVDSVWVEYAIHSSGGVAHAEGTFGLTDTGDAHFGTFPATAHKMQEGESVSYRIFARDISAAGNVAVSPEEGYYHVNVTEQGVLRAYDFEGLGQGLQAAGLWQRSKPAFGLRVAHSGQYLWATNPAAAYPASAQTSSLQLPTVDLSGIGSTYLVFWHWYDFEQDGQAKPGDFIPDAGIWDGGNVKVSTDGGSTWDVVEPEGGYNGTISDAYGNQLGGQPGFGGYSYGWRREIVPLPESADVRVRFDFGTDESNRDQALYFAGWHIDDVSITTTYPEDDVPPTATTLPDARTILIAGQDDMPGASLAVDDDTGVEAVVSEYRIITAVEEETGSIRLAMATSDRNIYAGDIVPLHSFAAGDRIEFSLIVRDFDGNEAIYPAPGDTYVIDFRSSQQSNALTSVVSTGAWRRQGSTWVTGSSAADEPVSSLVLEPFTLPSNGEASAFVLQHRFVIDGAGGGNLKVSADDAVTWTVLEPTGGYPRSLPHGGSHSMGGQGVFAGSSDGTARNTFDLSDYAGRNVRLRLDFASPDVSEAGQWFVEEASYETLSSDEEFKTAYELKLHANFPDPFANQTTITYSIPERSPVRVSVYDMLGRRVALVRHVEQEAGIYTVPFDGSDLANGVYMLYLETTMGTRTERMVVAR